MRNGGWSGSVDASEHFDGRWRWLGHPAFIACVAVLGLNDHVLKDEYHSWWTGKLSDFAGVVVVAVLLAVVVGPRVGIVLTGVGFAALKTVPGVAEFVGPILGGVTLRDPTDLLALGALVLLWFILVTNRRTSTRPRLATPCGRSERVSRLRAAFSATVPIAGVAMAVVATTATSCAPDPAVIRVFENEGVLVAEVERNSYEVEWAFSEDGGDSWSRGARPEGELPTESDWEDPDTTGDLEACASDGTCWRIRERRAIERRIPNAAWREEVRLSDADFRLISTGCFAPQVGVLTSIAASEVDGEPRVVASLGADGVVVRDDTGTWSRQGVLSASPSPLQREWLAVSLLALLGGPVLGACLLTARRERWLSWRKGFMVLCWGWIITVVVAGGIAVFFTLGSDMFRILTSAYLAGPAVAACAGMIATVGTAISVAKRPPRSPTPPWGWGPPPPPPEWGP